MPEIDIDRCRVIVNPTAQGGRALRRLRRLEPWVAPEHVLQTQAPGHVESLVGEALEDGAETLVVAGGDGTLNEVINSLNGASCQLGILPVGTMNVFARELGLPWNAIGDCWEIIRRGRTKEVDLFSANDRLFVQMAGVGLDAKTIASTSSRFKKLVGPFAFVWRGLTLLRGPHPRLQIVTGEGDEDEAFSVLVGNGRFYGGSLPLFSKANHQDGLLDVLLFYRLGLPDIARAVEGSMRSRPWENHPGVRYLQTRELKITSQEPVEFELEGEWSGHTPLSIRPHAERLTVIC